MAFNDGRGTAPHPPFAHSSKEEEEEEENED
jgi:hypothetical protein